jgi:transcriptional regulator with XRE-family HTH domain
MLQTKEAIDNGMSDERKAELGRYISEQREKKGMSLRALAEAADLSPGGLSEIEHGLRLAQPETLERLAAALGIDWEDLHALAGYRRPASLPSFGPYLRSKYGEHLSPKELKELESYFRTVTDGKPLEDQS